MFITILAKKKFFLKNNIILNLFQGKKSAIVILNIFEINYLFFEL